MTRALWWFRAIFRWFFFAASASQVRAALTTGLSAPASLATFPISTITYSFPLTTQKLSAWANSSLLHLPPFISLLTRDNSKVRAVLLPPRLYLSPAALSFSEPCEPVTLTSLSIRAYVPRGLERITCLTSPCQMFMTKINTTCCLNTYKKPRSSKAFSL